MLASDSLCCWGWSWIPSSPASTLKVLGDASTSGLSQSSLLECYRKVLSPRSNGSEHVCVPDYIHAMFVYLVNSGAYGARREGWILWNRSLLMWALRTKLRSSARAAISLGLQSNLWTPDNLPTLTVWVSLLHRLKSLWYWGRKEQLNLGRPMRNKLLYFLHSIFFMWETWKTVLVSWIPKTIWNWQYWSYLIYLQMVVSYDWSSMYITKYMKQQKGTQQLFSVLKEAHGALGVHSSLVEFSRKVH